MTQRTFRALALLVVVPALALAQDVSLYNRALSSFNGGDYDAAALAFNDIVQGSTDADLRGKAEYYLAQSLWKKGLPLSAAFQFAGIVRTGKVHPNYLKAVEALVTIQQQLDEPNIIPSLLNKTYSEDWATLPVETLARVNYLIGTISQRSNKFDEAAAFLEAVQKESPIYPKAQYLLGIVLVDPRYPGGAKTEAGIAAFENVLSATRGQDLELTQQLARLALGRTYYGMGEYQKSVDAYEQLPRYSRYWDQALFENGWARFRNDDFGGALGSLQALHAPQFAGAFQPESWTLKATVYYFSCLHEEAKTALGAFDEIYMPMHERLQKVTQGERDADYYFNLVNTEASELPKPVVNWVRGSQRVLDVLASLKQIDAEKQAISANQAWRSKLSPDLISTLDENRANLVKVAGQLVQRRLVEAERAIKTYSDTAEIIRFETSKAEKEIAEAGVDQRKLLASQALHRPKMPAEDWNYWKFQGEFWRDEIGYYQYTLKTGCLDQRSE